MQAVPGRGGSGCSEGAFVTDSALVDQLQQIDRLLEAGKLDAAGSALDAARAGADGGPTQTALLELFEVALAVSKNEIPAGLGLNRIVSVMRRIPDLPLAREVYQRVSDQAYRGGQSNLAHSHPPPPPDAGNDD